MVLIDEFGEVEIRPDEMETQYIEKGNTKGWVGEVLSLIRLGRHILIDDELDIVICKETEKAVQLQISPIEEDDDEEYTRSIWVPRSVFTATEFGLEVQPWFVKKNQLGQYTAKITRFRREE